MAEGSLMPEQWMERLFARLSACYGNRMATMWGDCPRADIMDAWREGLRGVDPARVSDALARVHAEYPEWPPTLGEFVALCRRPTVEAAHRPLVSLPRPKHEPIPENIKAQIDELTAKWKSAG